MSAAGLYLRNIAPLPPVPSVTPIFKGTISTDTDETTTLFSSVDIGVPHPKRVVIFAGIMGANAAVGAPYQVTVNGISPCAARVGLHGTIQCCPVPAGNMATIRATLAGSVRKYLSVYVAYPDSPFFLDSIANSAVAGTNAVGPDLKVQAGGFVIYSGSQATQPLSTLTTTWGGPEPVVNSGAGDVQTSNIELTSCYTTGRIIQITDSHDLNDLTLAASLTGTKIIIAGSWGPPPPGN